MKKSKEITAMILFSKIVLISLLILFASCHKEKYYDLPENIRQALFYYKYNTGDSLRLIRNNTDTLCFTVGVKSIFYNEIDYSNFEQYERFMISKNSNYTIGIHAMVSSSGSDYIYAIQIYPDVPGPRIYVNNIKSNFSSKLIDGKLYSNVYFLNPDYDASRKDTVYTSPNVGFIKACNDSLSLIILE